MAEEDNKNLHETVGVVVVAKINDCINILYIKRRDDDKIEPSKLTVPGGHIEYKEAPEEAAKRELEEEIDLIVKIEDIKKIGSFDTEFRLNNGKIGKMHSNAFITYIGDYNLNNIKLEEGTSLVIKNFEEFKLLVQKSLGRDVLKEFTIPDVNLMRIYGNDIIKFIEGVKEQTKSKSNV